MIRFARDAGVAAAAELEAGRCGAGAEEPPAAAALCRQLSGPERADLPSPRRCGKAHWQVGCLFRRSESFWVPHNGYPGMEDPQEVTSPSHGAALGLWLRQPLGEVTHSSCTPKAQRASGQAPWEGVSVGTRRRLQMVWAALGALVCLLSPAASAGLTGASRKAEVAASREQFFLLFKSTFLIPILCICQPVFSSRCAFASRVEEPVSTQHLPPGRHFSSAISSPLLSSLISHVNK